jgi:hypothetical protein
VQGLADHAQQLLKVEGLPEHGEAGGLDLPSMLPQERLIGGDHDDGQSPQVGILEQTSE